MLCSRWCSSREIDNDEIVEIINYRFIKKKKQPNGRWRLLSYNITVYSELLLLLLFILYSELDDFSRTIDDLPTTDDDVLSPRIYSIGIIIILPASLTARGSRQQEVEDLWSSNVNRVRVVCRSLLIRRRTQK